MKPADPYHAHIYYRLEDRMLAEQLQQDLFKSHKDGSLPELSYIGKLRDFKVGPHPLPQFEIHFTQSVLAKITEILKASGLTVLLHPLTDNDLADHTSLATWIGQPLDLDLTVLDPPGKNQGIARFSKTDF